jgi:hypothetical protein
MHPTSLPLPAWSAHAASKQPLNQNVAIFKQKPAGFEQPAGFSFWYQILICKPESLFTAAFNGSAL